MTSKTSFSKLLKEHMRHRLGVTVITFVYFLFALMFFVITIQNSMAYEGWTRAEVYATVLNASGPNSLLILCAALGALTAICGFAYLHSRTKIDFFHSLPVKRKAMFRASWRFLSCISRRLPFWKRCGAGRGWTRTGCSSLFHEEHAARLRTPASVH